MSFNQNQVRKLRSKLKSQHVRTREADGLSLSYLEGWHVVAEANRIFGFDGWDRETISSDCVWTKQMNGRYCAAYVTRIRIRVRAGEAVIIREGSGAGESNAASPGQAHEFAAKAAETDATKRALMTFGNAFGLSLYGGSHDPKAKTPDLSANPPMENGREEIACPLNIISQNESKEQPPRPPSTSELNPTKTVPYKASIPVTLPGPEWPIIKPLEEAERLNH